MNPISLFPVHYKCQKCGERRDDVRVIRSHRHYCLSCCPVGREEVQAAIDLVRVEQRRLSSLQDEMYVTKLDLMDCRQQLKALVEQGAQLSDEEWRSVGMRPDAVEVR